jgi:hypothetical protein
MMPGAPIAGAGAGPDMWRRIFAGSTLLAALAVLAGCAGLLGKLSPAAPAASRMKVVVLAPIGLPDKADVRVLSSAGEELGMVGTLVDRTRFAAKRAALAKTLNAAGFSLNAEVQTALLAALRGAGFEVRVVDGRREGHDARRWLKTLPPADGVDFVLDAYIAQLGYFAGSEADSYRPAVDLRARFVEPATQKEPYAGEIIYNGALNVTTGSKATVIPVDPAYTFKSSSALSTDPARTAEGLRAALRAVTTELSRKVQ